MERSGATTTEARLENAFRLLANETRIRILFALDSPFHRPLSFSELHDRVGTGDSGQFNYHLGQLTDRFIYRTEGGYRLLFSGVAVCRSMLAALPTDSPTIDPFALDGACHNCGATLEAAYEREYVHVRCPECGARIHYFPFPPGTLEGRSAEEFLQVYDQWIRAQVTLAKRGLCLWCYGRMGPEIVRDGEAFDQIYVDHACERCAGDIQTTVGENVLTHPAVVSFLYDHDIDVSQTPSWDLAFVTSGDCVTVLEETPWRLGLDIVLGDERLRLTVDGEMTVLDATRE